MSLASLLTPRATTTDLLVYGSGSLPISTKELNLKRTLLGGQSFRWFEQAENEFVGVLNHFIVVLNHVNENLRFIFYVTQLEKNQNNKTNEYEHRAECASILYEYFQLSINLSELIEQWQKCDERFLTTIPNGIRVLKQDPFENLLCFICSSNNNVQRITKMIDSICELYGKKIGTLNDKTYYQFPLLDALNNEYLEKKLRDIGFGYRARYIYEAVKFIKNECGGMKHFQYLETLSVQEARNELLRITGVGIKVADCVLLMSLNKSDVVPVDTHMKNIAVQFYGQGNKADVKNLSKANYREISSYFEQLWTPKAGWAQAAAFAVELKMPKRLSNISNSSSIKSQKRCSSGNENYIVDETEWSSSQQQITITKVKNKSVTETIDTEQQSMYNSQVEINTVVKKSKKSAKSKHGQQVDTTEVVSSSSLLTRPKRNVKPVQRLSYKTKS